MLLDSLDGIVAAGGCEAAYGRRERRNALLVELDGQQQRPHQQPLNRKEYFLKNFHLVRWLERQCD